MVTAFVQHRVKDYDAWRRVYDSVADMQKAGGVIRESVHRAEGDSNLVMVSHQFPNISAANDFAAAGGWLDTGTLQQGYQQCDLDTLQYCGRVRAVQGSSTRVLAQVRT